MAVPNNMDALEWLRKHLEDDDNDLLREMVRTFAEPLMGAEVDVLCDAGYGEVTPGADQQPQRLPVPAARHAGGDDRSGDPEAAGGQLLPGLAARAPPPAAERALVAVVAECYVRGVSHPAGGDLVQTLGIEWLSKTQVSPDGQELDAEVAAFRNRPLDGGPYTYVWLDAMTQKVREDGRIVNVAVVIAVGVNAEATGRSSASTSSPPRTAPAGWRSCAGWWRAAWPA